MQARVRSGRLFSSPPIQELHPQSRSPYTRLRPFPTEALRLQGSRVAALLDAQLHVDMATVLANLSTTRSMERALLAFRRTGNCGSEILEGESGESA